MREEVAQGSGSTGTAVLAAVTIRSVAGEGVTRNGIARSRIRARRNSDSIRTSEKVHVKLPESRAMKSRIDGL